MKETVFQFRKFEVEQACSAMKVGTDGVLLGAWCDVGGAARALDIGSGTGLISLMLAQRNPQTRVDAVEIDELAAEEARRNFLNSPWSGRLRLFHSDFLSLPSVSRYDLVVSNPPFFSSGKAAPDRRRAVARHSESLPFSALFRNVSECLSDAGRFALIAPVEEKPEIEFLAGEMNFWMKRRTAVRSAEHKPVKRFLWEFSKLPAVLEEDTLAIHAVNGGYTAEYKCLVKDFYLESVLNR